MTYYPIWTTIGVYYNGEYKINGVLPEDLAGHIQYNIKNRPGRALFLNGECIYRGYYTWQEAIELQKKFDNQEFAATKISNEYV